MRVGYSRNWSLGFLVLGALTAGINLVAARHGGNLIGLIPGVVCLVVGVAYRVKPYFYFEGGALVVPAALGPLKKTYPFEPGQLRAREGALWLGEKKLGLRRWLADKGAWDQLATRLASAEAFD